MAKTLALPKDPLVKQALIQMQNSLADNTWTDRQKLALTCRILFEHGHDSGDDQGRAALDRLGRGSSTLAGIRAGRSRDRATEGIAAITLRSKM